MDLKLVIIACICLCIVNACDRATPERSDGKRPIRYPSYKRSVHDEETLLQWDGSSYSINLSEDPCNFDIYDTDSDGTITQGELFDMLGVDKTTEALFKDLNSINDDGVITHDEFEAKVSTIIYECTQFDE